MSQEQICANEKEGEALKDAKSSLIGSEVHGSRGGLNASVIVLAPLLIALVSFFIERLIECGADVFWEYSHQLGVFVIFIRVNNKVFEWTSSTFAYNPSNRSRIFDIPTILMNGIALTGNRITATFRLLDLLGLQHHSKAATIKRQATQLKPAVTRRYDKQLKLVLENLPKGSIKVQSDEQHSRNPRARGHAPFCTGIIIENFTGFILARAHVWRNDHTGKDRNKLAAMAQNQVFQALVLLVPSLYIFY